MTAWFKVAAQCVGKHPFASRAIANEVARASSKKRKTKVMSYQCEHCNQFHIGHQSDRKISQKVRRPTHE